MFFQSICSNVISVVFGKRLPHIALTPVVAAWSCNSVFSGCQVSSASKKATHSPRLAKIPVFLAAERPRLRGCLIKVIGYRPAIAAVSSLDPSSTTMISRSGSVCAKALWMAFCRNRAALYAGITALTRESGGFDMGYFEWVIVA